MIYLDYITVLIAGTIYGYITNTLIFTVSNCIVNMVRIKRYNQQAKLAKDIKIGDDEIKPISYLINLAGIILVIALICLWYKMGIGTGADKLTQMGMVKWINPANLLMVNIGYLFGLILSLVLYFYSRKASLKGHHFVQSYITLPLSLISYIIVSILSQSGDRASNNMLGNICYRAQINHRTGEHSLTWVMGMNFLIRIAVLLSDEHDVNRTNHYLIDYKDTLGKSETREENLDKLYKSLVEISEKLENTKVKIQSKHDKQDT